MVTLTPFLAASLADSLNPFDPHLLDSGVYLRAVNLVCVVGILLAVLSGRAHLRAAGASGVGASWDPDAAPKEGWPTRGLRLALFAGIFLSALAVGYRWVEVNHFPSQTMSEVIVMFSSFLLVAMAVLHFVLAWYRDHGPRWAMIDDALVGIVFAGTWACNHYSVTLSTAQRDLPPALQSYWFAPHLIALIFSYASLGIAATIVSIYFARRFWLTLSTTGFGSSFSGKTVVWGLILAVLVILLGIRTGLDFVPNPNVFWMALIVGCAGGLALAAFGGARGRTAGTLVFTFSWMAFLPFGHFLTLPILGITGLALTRGTSLDTATRAASLKQDEMLLDAISFKAFAVGFPFLTAGLFMGAFWAQEAWANYWGWDSKENTALISWLIYVLYVHVRLLGGYRGSKAMGVLVAGALSIFITFQIFGYLPDSQKSMHRYTDDGVVPKEGMQGASPTDSARVETEPVDGSGDAPADEE